MATHTSESKSQDDPNDNAGHTNIDSSSSSSSHDPKLSIEQNNEWAKNLSTESTAVLNSKLSALRTESKTLSSNLTARLASSPSGQSLLHIGPSLSTLPPDLQCLLSNLKPMLHQVQEYQQHNHNELVRVVTASKMIQRECRRATFAQEAALLLKSFKAVELIVEQDQRLDFSSAAIDGDGNGDEGGEVKIQGDRDRNGNANKNKNAMEIHVTDEELNHMASLERVAHTTLHLMQQLQSSSEQITVALSSSSVNANDANATTKDGHVNVNIHTPLPGDTERAQFTMKLAPRIRALEKKATRAIGTHLERVLKRRMDLYHSSNDGSAAGAGTSTGNDKEDNIDDMYDDEKVQAPAPVSSSPMNPNSNELLLYGNLFRSFTLLNRASDAEAIFARVAIMPLVRNKISIGKLDEGGSRGECAGLSTLLEHMKDEICTVWGNLLRSMEGNFDMYVEGAESKSASELIQPQVDLVTAGVWVPILTALLTDPAIRMAIFSPGIASIFQQNYSILDTFVSNLAVNLLDPDRSCLSISTGEAPATSASPSKYPEHYNHTSASNTLDPDAMALTVLYYSPQIDARILRSAQSRIYAHPMTNEYSKKWNLPIYYQLRFGQICARVEEAIRKIQYSNEGWHRKDDVMTFSNASDDDLTSTHGFELAFFRELADSLSWFWRDDVFLKPLTHRFLRGTIQILGRIITFIKDGLVGEVKFGLIDQDQEEEGKEGHQENNEVNGSSNIGVGMNRANANEDSSAYEYTWCDRIEDVAAISWELTVLEKYIVQQHIPTIIETICSSNSQDDNDVTVTLVNDIMTEASKEITPVVHNIWDEIIVNIMISKCSTPLLAVKGIAATYRMTNRPPPTQPSPFVNAILRPLHEFDASISNRTPPSLGISWKKKIVDSVSEKYSTAVSELIETVKRTEEALKNRKARRAMAGGMSDGEKVRLQLYLDQKAFILAVESAGLDPPTVEGVLKLIELTKEGAPKTDI